MRKPSLSLKTVVLLSILAVAFLAQLPSTRAQVLGDRTDVVASAAKLYGLNAHNLKTLHQSQGRLPVTGVSLTQAKVLDQSTGRVYGVTLNAKGETVNFEAAQRAELRAYKAKFGTMTPQLFRKVRAAAPGAVLDVGFWLKSNHNNVVRRPTVSPNARGAKVIARVQAQEARNSARVARVVRKTVRPFVADVLASGNSVDYVARLSPAVFARVRASAVARLAADDRVQTTYYTGDRVTALQNIAKTTTAATKVWAKNITGVGVTGGVVECCGSLFEENPNDFDAENNAYLARVHEIRTFECADKSHPTAVNGIINSTHNSLTGIAKDARLVNDSATNCMGAQAEVVAAAQDVSAAVDGAMNHSYGLTPGAAEPCPTADGVGGIMERALDDLVRNAFDSQYVAAGNDGNAACVASPAIAWNVVAVGAFNDNNTNAWAGDTMAGFSQGGDPGSNNGDRQKPEVAGPGVAFQGLLPSNGGFPTGNIGNGTSYATPVYTGGGLLAEQRRPALLSWAEGEKAAIMASSCHNIEGGQTTGELDGAGGPDFAEMDNLLAANRETHGSIPNGTGVGFTQTFTGVANGNELRVALAWSQNTAYALYGSDPATDFDLTLKRPNGTIAATSSSFDNTHEVIEFVADATGTWTIEVNRFRTSDPAGFTFFGLAWHRYAPAACTAP